jgi:hypothetical protein
MKKILYLIIPIFFVSGCAVENPVLPGKADDTGSIVLKIDKENAPASVVSVNASLTREGFDPITSEMNLLADSTADLGLRNIPVGQWHLTIEAKKSVRSCRIQR